MQPSPFLLAIVVLVLMTVSPAKASSLAALSDMQRRELSVFGMRAMGGNVNAKDIKKTPDVQGMSELVAVGLNLKGFLCATVVDIAEIKIKGRYEVTCIATRGGKATKSYLVDPARGLASDL